MKKRVLALLAIFVTTGCVADLIASPIIYRADELCNGQALTKNEYRDCMNQGYQRFKSFEPAERPQNDWVDWLDLFWRMQG